MDDRTRTLEHASDLIDRLTADRNHCDAGIVRALVAHLGGDTEDANGLSHRSGKTRVIDLTQRPSQLSDKAWRMYQKLAAEGDLPAERPASMPPLMWRSIQKFSQASNA